MKSIMPDLLATVQVASDANRGIGVTVVFNDEVYTKSRAGSSSRPNHRVAFSLFPASDVQVPPVAPVKLGPGDDGRLLRSLFQLGYRGHVARLFEYRGLLTDLVRQMPIVFAKRRLAQGDYRVDAILSVRSISSRMMKSDTVVYFQGRVDRGP